MTKRNVHTSGPLGMLIQSGQVKKVEVADENSTVDEMLDLKRVKGATSYFKTQFGLEFSEGELLYVDPAECESWQYANRHEGEMGEMDALIESIRSNKQLQPALVRKHLHPHDGIKYEVVFGRRRHQACLRLGIPFWVICKKITSIEDAIVFQDAENKLRNNVSNYSNAILYGRLLEDKVFKSETALAKKLNMSVSTLHDLMSYTKIPDDIVKEIPDIHQLSKSIAVKITTLLKKSKANYEHIKDLAGKIGKTITSPTKLETALDKKINKQQVDLRELTSKEVRSKNGRKIFTYKVNHKGSMVLTFDKEISKRMDIDVLCGSIQQFLEKDVGVSGAPEI